MDDHEKDRYGVSWGQEKQRLTKSTVYSSFNLEGITYNLEDVIYVLGSDGPPYVAKILKMYEKVNSKEKCMLVRWFCRPCELPLKAAGVIFEEDCKEIFMMWGSGSKNVVNPASTIGKCKVLCTSPLDWNHSRPSEELIAGADHIFSFAFDADKLQVVSLNVVVKQFKESYITGIGVQIHKLKNKSNGSQRKPVHSDGPRFQPVRRASDGPSQVVKYNVGNHTKAMEPGVHPVARVDGSDRGGPQLIGRASDGPRLVSGSTGGNARKAMEMSDLIAEAKKKKGGFHRSGRESEPGTLGRPKMSDSSPNGLSEHQMNVSPVYKSNVTPKVRGVEVVGGELKGCRMPDARGGPPTRPVSRFHHYNVIPHAAEVEFVGNELPGKKFNDSEQGLPLRGVQNFFKLPWHKALEIALEKGKALRLQNLDPWLSSSEIEGMLTELLQVYCEARMLPPTDFSSYTTGEALVLFRSQLEAETAYAKFTENVLIWSKDQRPVVASLACKNRYEVNRFHGSLNLAKFNPTNAEFQKGTRGATSQCSQPNTVVFEMGLQWRLLQEQHREMWNLAAKVLHTATFNGKFPPVTVPILKPEVGVSSVND